MALIKPVSYGLLCKVNPALNSQKPQNRWTLFPPEELHRVPMVASATCLFVCLFVLFIAIPMQLIPGASACPPEPDLVSWAKPHPSPAATPWKCLLKEEPTRLQPAALPSGTGVCSPPRILPHRNTK